MQNGKKLWISWIYFPLENPMDRVHGAWIRSTTCGPGGTARVHRGPRHRGQMGMVVPWWRAARGC
jgi:hypothetical protein